MLFRDRPKKALSLNTSRVRSQKRPEILSTILYVTGLKIFALPLLTYLGMHALA